MRKVLILLTFILNAVGPSLVYAAAVTKVTANGVKYTVDKGTITMKTPVGLDYVDKIRYIKAQMEAPADVSPADAFAKSTSSSSSSSSAVVVTEPGVSAASADPRPIVKIRTPKGLLDSLKIDEENASDKSAEKSEVANVDSVRTPRVVPEMVSIQPTNMEVLPTLTLPDLKFEATPTTASTTGGIVPRPSIPVSQLNIPSTTVNDPMERPVERVPANNDAAIMNSYKYVSGLHLDSNGQVVNSGGHYEDKDGNTIIPGNKSLSGTTEVIPQSAQNLNTEKVDGVTPQPSNERINTVVVPDINGNAQTVKEHIDNDTGIITSTEYVKQSGSAKLDVPLQASSAPVANAPTSSIEKIETPLQAPAVPGPDLLANLPPVATQEIDKLKTPGLYSKEEMLESAEGKPPEDKSPGGNNFLYSNASTQILKRMGEPGFYVSKFLDYRKQINKPVCTASEKVNFASTMTSLVGEVTVHVFDYLEVKKLKKQFAAKLDEINKYKQDLQSNNKKLLDYDDKAPEIQLDSLKHLKSMAEVELKRAEMVRVFTYTALALDVTSQILSYMEATAEGASLGTLTAQREACANAQKLKVAATETQSGVIAEATSSWFKSLESGANSLLKVVQDNAVVKAYETAKKTISKEAVAEQLVADKSEIPLSQFAGIAGNAAYAENMMVSIVSDVIKKWRSGKTPKSAEDEINNLNNRPQSDSGIMKFFKTIGAEDLAIRAAVRILIKQNLVLVDTICKSAIGRGILFAYNVYTKYKVIEENQAQVEFAKQKISILNKTITDFEGRKTTWIPFFKRVVDNLLPTAEASALPGNYVSSRPLCIRELLPTCSLNKIDVIDGSTLKYFNALPKNVQTAQRNLISSNYSLVQAYKLASGAVSYDEIDLEKIKTEIKSLEAYAAQLEKKIPNQKEYLASKESTLKKLQGDVIFPATLMASYGKSPAMIEMADLEKAVPKKLQSPAGVQKGDVPLAGPGREVASVAGKVIQKDVEKDAKLEDYDIRTNYSSKESDLFQIISNRYQKIYSRIELAE